MILSAPDLSNLVRNNELITDPTRPLLDLINQVNPASIDVTLGSKLYLNVKSATDDLIDTISGVSDYRDIFHEFNLAKKKHFILTPGNFILAHTQEEVHVPNNLTCRFVLKSTVGRYGIDHAQSGLIDPGFRGKITLELFNHSQNPVVLFLGQRIGQLEFTQLSTPLNETELYQGKYQGDNSVNFAKPIKESEIPPSYSHFRSNKSEIKRVIAYKKEFKSRKKD